MKKYIIYTFSLLFLFSCNNEKQVLQEEESTANSNEITLSKQQMESIGLKIGKAEKRTLQQTVQSNGFVEVPPQNQASITTYAEGYVKKASLLVGDKVRKGQVLAILEHPNYIKLQQEYLEVLGNHHYLKTEYERQQTLDKENINSKKKLLKSEADYKVSSAKLKGFKSRLEMLGFDVENLENGNIISSIHLISPINGYISKMNVNVGKHVGAEEVLYEIIDPEHIHIELKVFEKDILKIKKEQKILFSLNGNEDKKYKADVHLVGKVLDEKDRTITIHAHPENHKLTLLPGMYVAANIIIGTKETLTVPVSALMEATETTALLLMKINKKGETTTFKKIKVKLGMKTANYCEIILLKGVSETSVFGLEGVFGLE